MAQKDIFFKFYANLPISVRKEIILDLSEASGPITWEIAYREINADTKLGNIILEKIINLGFLPTDLE